jgi:hypothetical protein
LAKFYYLLNWANDKKYLMNQLLKKPAVLSNHRDIPQDPVSLHCSGCNRISGHNNVQRARLAPNNAASNRDI